MSSPHVVTVDRAGRVALPADIRARHGWREGTILVTVDTDHGVLLTDRDGLETAVRAQLAQADLVAELMNDRRREAIDTDNSPVA